MDRKELERELRKLCVAHQGGLGPSFTGRRCQWCDSRMRQVMALVDTYAEGLIGDDDELRTYVTCNEVAKTYGLPSPAAARSVLSRARVMSAPFTRPHPVSGRAQALYDADAVHSAFQPKMREEGKP